MHLSCAAPRQPADVPPASASLPGCLPHAGRAVPRPQSGQCPAFTRQAVSDHDAPSANPGMYRMWRGVLKPAGSLLTCNAAAPSHTSDL